ncbi:hypothetical protein E4U43_001390 [Claviceps pusilla]|uniref:Uncharacterized protein n=1 Tax=Claviceps pusilla TaxID=123648 RepID=A0A9P7N8D2_9HYPO|nr:hypothetical protein E4U43_001390 [Claviceps pusilla]
MHCLRKFVELGASVNPEGDSVLVQTISYYKLNSTICSDVTHLIDFFLDHGADVNGRTMFGSTAIQELIMAIFAMEGVPSAVKLLKKLLHDLVERGMDLTSPSPAGPSPLCAVMHHRDAQPAWLFRFLCENGATLNSVEVNRFFIHWCRHPRLWSQKRFNMWQHVSKVSPRAVDIAYQTAFTFDDASLYNILIRQRLAASSNEKLVKLAFFSKKRWSWKKIVACRFSGTFTLMDRQENMLHLTVRTYETVPEYSAVDASRDISTLLRGGADITSQNIHGQDPLQLFLDLAPGKKDSLDLLAKLENEMKKAHDTQMKQQLKVVKNRV